MRDYGGRALCPVELYDDPVIREEMAWHALEQALDDAGWLEESQQWSIQHERIAPVLRDIPLGSEVTPGIQVHGHRLILRAGSDEHLGEDAAGLVDLTATLVPVGPAA